jgi:hypothetical protein
MQLQLVRATRETRQFDDIVRDFTPPMRRVCRHMADADLRQMIERMAQHQLAEEQRRCARPASRRTARPSPSAPRH